MAEKELAKIYAGALLDIGQENNILSRIEEELESLVELISREKDLMLFLNAPVVSKDNKKEFIEKLFSDTFCIDLVNFLKVLVDNDRQSLVPDIYKHFSGFVDQINNRQRIKLITSVALKEDALKRIEKSIGQKLKKNIILEEEIDESILGGIIIKIDDILIDGSIAKDLNAMKAKLIQRKVGSMMVYED